MQLVFGSTIRASISVLALALAGCAGPSGFGSATREQALRNGIVARVDAVEVKAENQLGLASEVGTSAGGLIGNQSGTSTRRDLATVLAAIGGGPAASEQPQRYAQARDGQRIIVRLDNGVGVAVTQEAEPDVQVGDRVRIEGRGVQARVLRR